jgi:ankyrin repeat protein
MDSTFLAEKVISTLAYHVITKTYLLFISATLMTEAFERAIRNNKHVYIEKEITHRLPVPANSANAAFQTGLMIACQHNSLETVRVFLQKSTSVSVYDPSFCNVNLVDGSGWTALHYAAQRGSLECVKLLIKNEAEINELTNKLETPLHIATQLNFFQVAQVLIESGAKVNAATNKNKKPIHFAAKQNFTEIVQLLIENKADLNCTTNNNETPLFLATKRNHPDVVEILAKQNCQHQTKALFTPRNDSLKKGFTALEVSVDQNYVEIITFLLSHGIRTKELSEKELSDLLVYAAEEGHTKIAQELLINGANVNDKGGKNFILFFIM